MILKKALSSMFNKVKRSTGEGDIPPGEYMFGIQFLITDKNEVKIGMPQINGVIRKEKKDSLINDSLIVNVPNDLIKKDLYEN